MKKLKSLMAVLLVAFAVLLVKDTAMAATKKLTDLDYTETKNSFDSSNYSATIEGRDGNTYTGDVIFLDASLDENYVTYNLNKKYSKLKISMVCSTSTTVGGNFSVYFYGDDKLLKSQENYSGSSTVAKEITVDVSNVKTLKITSTNTGFWANGFIYLVNSSLTGGTLTLSDSTLKLNVKESTYLTYSGESSTGGELTGTAKWKSSNKKVAKVSSKGKVVAVKPGVCKITCTVGDTSATAKVIVLPSKVTGVSTLSSGKNFVQLTWKAQSGVTGYKVYMYDPDLEEYTLMKTVKSGNSARISDLSKNKTYKFKVVAYVKSGKKTYNGDMSAVYKAKTTK
jgi:hypothetical protein